MANINESYDGRPESASSGTNEGATSIKVINSNNTGIKVEDPAIPLVGINGGFPHYGSSGKPFKYENVGARLARRKELFFRRKTIADCALAFAMLGIVLMICDTELCMANVFSKDTIGSILVKATVTLTTIILLGFIVWYHHLDIKVLDNIIDGIVVYCMICKRYPLELCCN